MLKVETPAPGEYLAAGPGGVAGLRAVERRPGAADERGAL
jgi:hypothetical protein